MKKLLSMLAVSTLSVTSTSSLKPMFPNNVSQVFKSNQNNKDISIHGENDTNPFSNVKIKNIEGDEVTTLVTTNDGTIYAGLYLNGIYKSTDGITFNKIPEISTEIEVTGLAVDKNNNIYVISDSGQIYKSADNKTFNKIADIQGDLKSIAINYIDNTIYLGSNKGLYKSLDGITFNKIPGITSDLSFSSVAISSEGKIYAGGGSGLYLGNNGSFIKNGDINDWVNSLTTDSNNNIYVATDKKIYKCLSGQDTFTVMTGINWTTNILITDSNNNIYAGGDNGVYKSADGITFNKISTDNIKDVQSLLVNKNGFVYVATKESLSVLNPINLLLNVNKPDTFDKSWSKYKGIVYSSTQKVDIKEKLVASATLDGKSITVPTANLDILIGEHNLILTLKDKALASAFGGDSNTGQVTYKLWVKTSIDKNKIDYQTKIDDTQLYTGLVSNTGNTNNADIIQTKIKNATGTHNASINIDFKDILIDFDLNKSFYVQGTVDNNNFTESGTKQKVQVNTEITTDGTYHLHLVDTVGNTYDSYLELGESNWKLTGTFDDSELDKFKSKLNVTVNLTDPSQKSKALGWLHQYENFVENKFNETIKTNGKGFDSEIKNQITSYTSFLKPLTYDIANEPKFDDGFDKDLLVKTITDKAKEIINKGLDALPKNLNVNTSNVVNKSNLEHYTNWINNYQHFINKNKDEWINEKAIIAVRGFATSEQIKKILDHINSLPFNKYLKRVEWTPNLTASGYDDKYLQYVELDKLQSDTIAWVNQSMPEINEAYQNAIKVAESGLNLHGYSIDTLLNGKDLPKTNDEIANFADGQSFHNWLQSQANIKFHGWQLTMGLGIGIPLFLIALGIAWFVRKATDPRYNPFARGRKYDKNQKGN